MWLKRRCQVVEHKVRTLPRLFVILFINPDGSENTTQPRNTLQASFKSELDTLGVDPVPNVMVSFYSFRLMIGLGVAGLGIGLLILWFARGDQAPPASRAWLWAMGALPFMPLLANCSGWILTEMDHQPYTARIRHHDSQEHTY